MKRTVVVNKKRFLAFLSLLTLLCFLMMQLVFRCLPASYAYGQDSPDYQKIYVQSGDTVWKLAEPIAKQKNEDTRVIVRQIYRLNHLDQATLQPGQPLLVPNI